MFVDAVRGTVRADVEVGRLDCFGRLEGVRIADWGCGEEGTGDGVAAAEGLEGLGIAGGEDEKVCLKVGGGEAGGVRDFVGAGEDAGVHGELRSGIFQLLFYSFLQTLHLYCCSYTPGM